MGIARMYISEVTSGIVQVVHRDNHPVQSSVSDHRFWDKDCRYCPKIHADIAAESDAQCLKYWCSVRDVTMA
jgi:hypothetical protein